MTIEGKSKFLRIEWNPGVEFLVVKPIGDKLQGLWPPDRPVTYK